MKYIYFVFIFILGVIVGRQTVELKETPTQLSTEKSLAVKGEQHSIKEQKQFIKSQPANALQRSKFVEDASTKMDTEEVRQVEVNNQLTVNDDGYWQQVLTTSQSQNMKLSAIDNLVDQENERDLASGLSDPSPFIRQKVLEGLDKVNSETAIRILGQTLFSEKNVETRIMAVELLSQNTHYPFVKPLLLHAFEHDKDDSVRKLAENALK